MPWTYILTCSDGSYYVGSTFDLQARLWQHNQGEGAAYTRHRRPVELTWCAEFESVRDAFHFEKQVQGWGRAKREALMAGRFDLLPGLASRSWSAARGRTHSDLPDPPRRPTARPVMPWDVPHRPADDPDDPWAPPVPLGE
jgi:putative endonuclease